MTDTPRTREELLAAFADGQYGTISAQDMRDFVVSAGVGPALRNRLGVFAHTGIVTVPASASEAYSAAVAAPLALDVGGPASYSYDPAGWADNDFSLADSDPTNSWGITISEGDVLMIPPGTITVGLTFSHEPVVYDGGARFFDGVFDQAIYDTSLDNGAASDGVEGWYYRAYYNSLAFTRTPGFNDTGTFQHQIRSQVLINDSDTEQPFFLVFIMRSQTADIDVVYYDLRVLWEPL